MITIQACCSDTVSAELKRLIRQSGLEQMVAVRPFDASDGVADVLIVQNECPQNARARVLIITDTCATLECAGVEAQCVVTVGLDPRNTITPSSMLHEGGMAALQRELVSLNGDIIYPREIELSHLKGSMHEKMIVAAAILVLGVHAQW